MRPFMAIEVATMETVISLRKISDLLLGLLASENLLAG